MLIARSAEKDSVSKFQRVAKSAVESLWLMDGLGSLCLSQQLVLCVVPSLLAFVELLWF